MDAAGGFRRRLTRKTNFFPVPMSNPGPIAAARWAEFPRSRVGTEGRRVPFLHRTEHSEIRHSVMRVRRRTFHPGGQERVYGELLWWGPPELHGEDTVVQGEGEVPERSETEGRSRGEEKAFSSRDDGVEKQREWG